MDRTEAFLIQLELHSFNQSEQLYFDQSGKFLLDQSNCEIWSAHLHEDRLIRDRVKDSCLYYPVPLWLSELTFPFHWKPNTVSPWPSWHTKVVDCREELSSQRGPWPQGCLTAVLFSQSSCFILNKVSFFSAPQIGDSCLHWIGANDHQLTKLCWIK